MLKDFAFLWSKKGPCYIEKVSWLEIRADKLEVVWNSPFPTTLLSEYNITFCEWSLESSNPSFQILGNEWKARMTAKDKSDKAKVSESESDEEEKEDYK